MKISGKSLKTFNAWATLVWLLLGIPTVIFWRESILWLALMSLWANIASHFAAWVAGRAEVAAVAADPDESE